MRVWGHLAALESEIRALRPSRWLASPKVTTFMNWLRERGPGGIMAIGAIAPSGAQSIGIAICRTPSLGPLGDPSGSILSQASG